MKWFQFAFFAVFVSSLCSCKSKALFEEDRTKELATFFPAKKLKVFVSWEKLDGKSRRIITVKVPTKKWKLLKEAQREDKAREIAQVLRDEVLSVVVPYQIRVQYNQYIPAWRASFLWSRLKDRSLAPQALPDLAKKIKQQAWKSGSKTYIQRFLNNTTRKYERTCFVILKPGPTKQIADPPGFKEDQVRKIANIIRSNYSKPGYKVDFIQVSFGGSRFIRLPWKK